MMTSFSKEQKCAESALKIGGFSFHGIPASDSAAGTTPYLQHLRAIGGSTFRSWKVQNEVAVDQPKTVMRVGAEISEAVIGSVAAVEAAMTAEVKPSMAEASSAVVAATAVVATVAAAAVAAAQAG